MFNNIYFRATLIAFLTLFVCACSNTTTNGNSSNGQNPHLIVEKNFIYIEGDSTDNFTLAVKLGDKITYEKSIKAKSKLPIISLLKEKNEFYNDIAYLLSQDKGKINILNSAALQFNFLFKFLGNKILPRILPCQIFHLP